MHWSGEPFSYEGTHFSARDVQARPTPVQQPIPIWLGGNARITLRRVAEKAQGWMPMLAGPTVAASARTPHLSTTADIAAAITTVKELAGERASSLDFVCSVSSLDLTDVERHKQSLGELEDAGATWIVCSGTTREPSATYDFLAEFGATYLR
jgi:alkanesulfonate monooxygenase SsuD/methylene tetrahydromethanopterin reductase-like flavin-dependent oxidoreductase (luciferase family)